MKRTRMPLVVRDRDTRLFLNDRNVCWRYARFAGELLDPRAVVRALARDRRHAGGAAARAGAAAVASPATGSSAALAGGAANPVLAEPDLVGLLRQRRIQDPHAGHGRRRGFRAGRRLRRGGGERG